MKSFDRHGRLKVVTDSGVSGGTADYALNDIWPYVWNDEDNEPHYLRAETIDGVSVLFLDEPDPKVQDDDDGLWRFLRSTTAGGSPALYLSDEADSVPGREAVVRDYTSGDFKRVKSRTIDGIPTIYLEDI